LPLLEFSWNKSYPDSIRMTPYDFVWKEGPPIYWISRRKVVLGPDWYQQTMDVSRD
jgi:hypothetical protein